MKAAKTAVVTGANGFVGKAVSLELARQDFQVYAVVRQGAERLAELSALPNITIVHCDMSDYARLPQLIASRDIGLFYHFAWRGSAGAERGDAQVQIANIQYSCDAVSAANALGCKRFILAGSIMEYEIEALMQTTQAPAISTLYCSAKKTADYMCRALAASLGMDYICGLISNIFGPGENSPRLINTSLRKLQNKERVSLSEGTQMYDFIYIDDAARAFAAIGQKGLNHKVYYIGSRHPKPLREFLLEMRDEVSPGTELGLGDFHFSGVSLTYQEFDVDAVYKDTGTEPLVSFRDGIARTAAWIKNESEGLHV